jgi:Uma2 family endonuclease
MSATINPNPPIDPKDQSLVLGRVPWDDYLTTSDALSQQHGLRLIYIDGRLLFLTKSRRHEWFAECLGQLVTAAASACDIPWEPAGETTFRRREVDAGLEGDSTYYLAANAERMRGPKDVDLAVDPPPDLAIEVEVSHPADAAMLAYGRLGVPEVWRFDASAWSFGIWIRNDDGSYGQTCQSKGIPPLVAAEVLEQLKLAESLGASRWHARLGEWARATMVLCLAAGRDEVSSEQS